MTSRFPKRFHNCTLRISSNRSGLVCIGRMATSGRNESRREKRYCAQCKRSCRNGDSLWVRKCNRRSSRQYFVKVDNTLRPNNNQRVCVTRTEDRKIHLYKCVGSTRQEWNGIDFGRNFELTAGQSNEKCLSQHHHPKEREVLYMEKCKLARRYDTSYWITR